MTARFKCAIYTRKSSEEGLDQSFNSLDAQREACEAYIRSQKHEGWVVLNTNYDDGGFSGGNMERPGLKKLMADIAQGKVDTVVVYKVDRLTRALSDFARIIEQFDSKGVTFVSVTQQFNTTTSMGRLTLNVLLSFAQFEREVTGERIRDKIAASKAKGMWMGGRVPLGYDLSDRRIYINPGEAEQVREIFRQYLRLRTVAELMSHLERAGIRSKARIGPDGVKTGGAVYSRGALYQILRNHLYIGEIEHKESIYRGEHEAIIDRDLWEQVQKILDQNRQGVRERKRMQSGSILTGRLFSESGVRYIPTNTQKGGRRYYYYTSQALIKGDQKDNAIGRLPAPALESAVTKQIQMFLQSPAELLDALKQLDDHELHHEKIIKQAKQKAFEWGSQNQPEKEKLISSIVHRVFVHDSSLEIQLNLESLVEFLSGNPPHHAVKYSSAQIFSLRAPFHRTQHGKALKLVIGNDRADSDESREAIAKAIARARSWYDLIIEGKASGLAELARKRGFTHRYVKNIFPLAFLGPESIELLLNEQQSRPRTLVSLMGKVPMLWEEQKAIIQRK